jgi:tRNA(Ile)-lysidine synthase
MRPRAGFIQRPILTLGRREVLAYLESWGLHFQDDESNADTRYLRNRVRHTLIPVLAAAFPHWEEPLLRLWETQGLTADFLAREAAARIPWHDGGTFLSAPEDRLFGEAEIIREEALFKALNILSSRKETKPGNIRIRRAALRPFLKGSVSALDLGSVRLENKGGTISVLPSGREKVHEENFSVLIKKPGVYKLILPGCVGGAGRELTVFVTESRTENSFFARFPLVLKGEKTGYTARDRKGIAASLDGDVFWKRPEEDTTGAYFAVK